MALLTPGLSDVGVASVFTTWIGTMRVTTFKPLVIVYSESVFFKPVVLACEVAMEGHHQLLHHQHLCLCSAQVCPPRRSRTPQVVSYNLYFST